MTAVRKSLRGPGINSKPSEEPLVPAISLPEKVPEWSSTGVDGYRVVSLPEGAHETVAGVLCSLATCPQSGKVSTTLYQQTQREPIVLFFASCFICLSAGHGYKGILWGP